MQSSVSPGLPVFTGCLCPTLPRDDTTCLVSFIDPVNLYIALVLLGNAKLANQFIMLRLCLYAVLHAFVEIQIIKITQLPFSYGPVVVLKEGLIGQPSLVCTVFPCFSLYLRNKMLCTE